MVSGGKGGSLYQLTELHGVTCGKVQTGLLTCIPPASVLLRVLFIQETRSDITTFYKAVTPDQSSVQFL